MINTKTLPLWLALLSLYSVNTHGAAVNVSYANPPISFEANIGQADSGVQFVARGPHASLLLMEGEACLTLAQNKREPEPARNLRLRFSGGNAHPSAHGINFLPGKANYLIGNDPAGWHTNVPTFGKVEYHGIYHGVDLVYYGNQQNLEFDLIIQPGASPADILMQFTGAEKMSVDANGDLLLQVSGETIRQHKPVVYQEINGEHKMLAGDYVIHSGMEVGFQVENYDRTRPLIIDPVLAYAATFGGSKASSALAIAVDAQDNVYVTGKTTSTDYPIVGGVQTNFMGNRDAFVTKFDTNGAMVYSTYLGGGIFQNFNQSSSGQAIAVDEFGDAFVTGYTQVTNFPVKNAFRATNSGGADVFVAELNPNGNGLVFSTYLGGNGNDTANGLALDTNANIIITGYTASTNFPTANAAQTTNAGNGDAFVTKLSADGSSLIYSTYLGGASYENYDLLSPIVSGDTINAFAGGAVAVDESNNAYVTGWTYSTNFPALKAFQATNSAPLAGAYAQAFVTKFDPAGNLVYSTYFGRLGACFGRAISVDFSNNVYFAGSDASGLLPATNSYGGRGSAGIGDGFVAKLDASGTNLVYCAYVGGGGDDQVNGLAIRRDDGTAAITGFTESADFPLNNPVQPIGYQGLFKSSNSGSNWNLSTSGLTGSTIYSIQFDPANSSIIYAATPSGVFKSSDAGVTWVSANNGLSFLSPSFSGSPQQLLAVDPSHSGVLYCATFSAVFKTTNGGVNWFNPNVGPAFTSIFCLAVDPNSPSTIYAGTFSGIYKSTNGGTNWTAMNTGLTALETYALLVDPQNSSNVYAGIEAFNSARNLYKSTNGGANWTLLSGGLPTGEVDALAGANSAIYAIVNNDDTDPSLVISTNGGTNWLQLFQGQGIKFTALAIGPPSLPSNPSLTLVQSGNNELVSWPASFTNYALQSSPSLSPANWANVSQPRGTNNGNIVITNPIAGPHSFYRLVGTNSGASSSPTIYLGTDAGSGQGLFKSINGGVSWNTSGPFGGNTIGAVAINPSNPSSVFTGLNGGRDAFVSILTPGGQLDFSTYLGGSGADRGNAIALLSDQSTAVTVGATTSSDFPTTVSHPAAQLSRAKRTPEATPLDTQGTAGVTQVGHWWITTIDGVGKCPDSKIFDIEMTNGESFVFNPDQAGAIGVSTSGDLPPGFSSTNFFGSYPPAGLVNATEVRVTGVMHATVGQTFTYVITFTRKSCVWTYTLNFHVIAGPAASNEEPFDGEEANPPVLNNRRL